MIKGNFEDLTFDSAEFDEVCPEDAVLHSGDKLKVFKEAYRVLKKEGCETDYIANIKKGLKHWIEGGKKGYLNWGILQFFKQ